MVVFSSFELSQGIGVKIFVAISLCLSMTTSSGKQKKKRKKEMKLLSQRVYIVLRLLLHDHKLFYGMVGCTYHHKSFHLLANWKGILLRYRLC